jgi:hypothetical protein
MYSWYDFAIDSRAHKGGEIGVDGKQYKGGEFMPFYVPRPEMPQIDEKDYPEFFEFVESQGWSYHQENCDPKTLHFHQRVTWNSNTKITEEVLEKPILVSRDGYVLDGNHRATAHLNLGTDTPAIILNLDFEPAIRLMFSFPKTYAYGDGKVHGQSL